MNTEKSRPSVYSRADLSRMLGRANLASVARETGISYNVVRKARNGGDINLSTAEKFSAFFGT